MDKSNEQTITETKSCDWDALERAIVLINKPRETDLYNTLKILSRKSKLENNFIGFVEERWQYTLSPIIF